MMFLNELRLWFDRSTKTWRRKRLNLAKIPEKYRCPKCGRILIQSWDDRIIDSRHPIDWGYLKRNMKLHESGVCMKCHRYRE